MAIQSLTPMLVVPKVWQAVEFYVDQLGFRRVRETGELAAVERDGVEIMFALPNARIPFSHSHLTGSLCFRTDAVDALWEELKEKANVFHPIETYSYGMREFAITDCFGYLLQFGQEVR